jgi:purine-binding chemotaxis protein CheW
MSKEDAKPKGKEKQLVIFCLREEEFGVEICSVLEISRVPAITKIPQAPCFIEGVMNLRGKVLAVIDLARQFGMKEEKELPKTARIIVVEARSRSFGLIVDEVPEVIRISEDEIEPAPEIIQSEIKRDYIKGVAKIDERLIIILDLDNILAPHEMEAVGKIRA